MCQSGIVNCRSKKRKPVQMYIFSAYMQFIILCCVAQAIHHTLLCGSSNSSYSAVWLKGQTTLCIIVGSSYSVVWLKQFIILCCVAQGSDNAVHYSGRVVCFDVHRLWPGVADRQFIIHCCNSSYIAVWLKDIHNVSTICA